MYYCALCNLKACKLGEPEKMPKKCPNSAKIIEKSKELYLEEENEKIAYNSALVESEGYCKLTRIEETILFAKKMNYKKLGIAFCTGLSNEAKILQDIFLNHDFDVESVVCKCGSIPKEFIKITENEKVHKGEYEAMCNPIGQALFLNETKTDLNIILGLCVGHDSLFIKYSKAPVTIIGVKDRVLGHNPLAAIYTSNSYYKEKLFKNKE
ncbi:putative metal-binding protein [Methanococcus maripaludis]|uniref:Putative metal-binding protein n=1 Tax=Methanococcus maripaludis TaxID=39152 RepID=A0A7J9NSU6_METMI|nr:DUF1847 domain-containing protein [Methanococcus maripaludis]MBA2850752.1 putative metal-binding protein [Methanococcus maripaludis]MBA2858187.1 putative metal-binding protein [Methanococcus maripaludis]